MNFKLKHQLPHHSMNFLYDILKSRGIEDCDRYLTPMPIEDCQHDAGLLDNISIAAHSLHEAIVNDETIFLVVDSDADGYCSASLLYRYIMKVHPEADIISYLHTGKQHGVVLDVIPNDVSLVLLPDAGSNQYEEHARLREMGIKTIVLDHHLADKYSDDAIVVNNQLSVNYPNKSLCGAGVVYKFLQFYDKEFNFNHAEDDIDLVAIAEVSDMMDLRPLETRNICYRGLNNITNVGIIALRDKNSFSLGGRLQLTTIDVAFYIAPYINALVRVGTQEEKQVLFWALVDGSKPLASTKRGSKPGDIEYAGEAMARMATNAKNRQARLVEAALEILEGRIQEYDLLSNKILLLKIKPTDKIETTITGLVAMKLTAKYHRPTLLLHECDDGVLKGSIRAENNTSLGGFKEYLDSTGSFEYVEGHSQAAGAGIADARVESFIEDTNKELAQIDFSEMSYPVDYIITDNENLSRAVMDVGQAGIWGQRVEEPLFAADNLTVKKSEVTLMKNDSMKFTHNDIVYTIFKNPQACTDFTANEIMSVSLVGRANVNEWCGKISAQIFVSDYEIKPWKRQF